MQSVAGIRTHILGLSRFQMGKKEITEMTHLSTYICVLLVIVEALSFQQILMLQQTMLIETICSRKTVFPV